MRHLGQDLRFGLRGLVKSPGFTALAVLALTLGIGANSAIFTVVDSVLLRPLRYPEPERLVAVFSDERRIGEPRNPTSPGNFVDWQAQSSSFEAMSAAQTWSPSLTGLEHPERLTALKASANLFELLGVAPALGRGFAPGDGGPDADGVVVLGDALWRRQFGADPAILGRPLMLDGRSYAVVGVMPPGFSFPPFWATGAELWTPLVLSPEQAASRDASFLRVFARLKPGVSVASAGVELNAIGARLAGQYPDTNAELGVTVEALQEPVVRNARPALLVLLATVGLVLLIGCANVASLLLARSAARQQEMAVRTAVGATRSRLVQQMMTEGAILALIGGAAGMVVGAWGVHALVALRPAGLPRLDEIAIDGRVLGFTLVVSLLTSVLFGLAPALRASRSDLGEALKSGGRNSAGLASRRPYSVLVACEIALALVLLIGAGLMIQTFVRLQRLDPGFRTSGMLTASLSLASSAHSEPAKQVDFLHELIERVAAIPGVRAVGLMNHLPIGGDRWRASVLLEDAPGGREEEQRAGFRVVTPGLFQALGVPLMQGRWLAESDGPAAPRAVLVNSAFARQFWPGADPLGKRFKTGAADAAEPWLTVIGVVGDVRQERLNEEARPEVYYPYRQNPVAWYKATTLVVQAETMAPGLAAAVRDAVWSIDRDVPISELRTMEQILNDSVSRERLNMLLLGVFAGIALTLAIVGTYGTIAYSVSQRTREIGIRIALGARARDVLGMVLRQSMAAVLAGVSAGLVAAALLTRFAASLLYGVSATDPLTFLGVAVLLVFVAFVASAVPARSAARIQPTVALRAE